MRPIALLVVLTVTPLTLVADPSRPAELTLSVDETAILEAANAERAKAGLVALKPNPLLFAAARSHAANMAKQDKLAHDLDGKTAFDRITAAGYKHGYAGENIGWNYQTPKDAVAGWMASEGHRANILNKDYVDIGVAVARNTHGEPYWVQVFASPLGK